MPQSHFLRPGVAPDRWRICCAAVSVLEALVLGAVQGLTEFVPVSSSGHLVIVPELFGWEQPGLTFDVLLHVASLIALLIYFSGDLIDIVKGMLASDRASRRLAALLIIGTVPAAIAGLAFGDFFEEQFTDAKAAAVQLVLTALILIGAELALSYHRRRTAIAGDRLRKVEDLRIPDSLLIGGAQAISILPGISRSGSTIGAGLALSMEREDAARFAFLLAIPALFGAAVVKVPDMTTGTIGLIPGIVGFVASLVTSYAAIWGLIRYLKTNSLYPFAVYCLIAGPIFYFVV
jgi:undecaprenyl-diphosphatase